MNALVQRIERIVGTVRDPISYRLLWCGLTNRLVSIPGGNFDSGAPANSGWPMDAPSRNSDRIPRIIFQPWTSRHALPANYAYWRQSFVANNPGYKFFFWDDSDNRRFIAEWFPWFLARFDSYPREIFRQPKRVVFPEGEEPKILRACQILMDEKIARPVLLGDEARIRAAVAELHLRVDGLRIVDPAKSGRL